MSSDETYLALSRNERDVLLGAAIADGREGAEYPHGASVREWLLEERGESLYSNQLYGAIESLTKSGLIEKEQINGRDTGLRLTDEGRERLEELRALVSQADNGGQ